MIVVSDTTPLNYLIQLGYAELLKILYDRVLIPVAVMKELQHSAAPGVVREWVLSPPSWLEVATARRLDPDLSPELDAGEREAISLALEIHPEFLLIDEKLGRQEAQNRSLQVAGTLEHPARVLDSRLHRVAASSRSVETVGLQIGNES